jgi:cellulose synthase/poly-beta-1,6-N-acetylglucosamine synthase-like glycosyltransferase
VVVADNCTDRTAGIGRAEGAVVLERTSADEKGKGHALRWAFDRLLQESYEGFVVCDADTVASANLLAEVNSALDGRAPARQ